MKLHFKQRFFSWFDSYDIYDENGNTVFTVEGQFAWGHVLHINDASGRHIATVKQVIFSFLRKFDFYIEDNFIGRMTREFTFFKPVYTIDFNGWEITGDFMGWDYSINSGSGTVAFVSKELFNWTDTYTIDVANQQDALVALMTVLSIDADKCSSDSSNN